MARSSSKAIPTQEHEWQSEDDFRTLRRADEINSDRGRLSRAHRYGKKELKSYTRILGSRRK